MPSNINMGEKYPKFSKWIASIFQVIIDLLINDCNTNQSLWQKIYPQKNGYPVYNSSGRYWVKLFFMGKFRKVEVDDLIPCGKYEELLLPKCVNLEELWPVILAKALIKLFSFKYKTTNTKMYEEIGDTSIIHALTGYIPEKLKHYEDYFPIFQNILSDSNFTYKRKYLIGYYPLQDGSPGKEKETKEIKGSPIKETLKSPMLNILNTIQPKKFDNIDIIIQEKPSDFQIASPEITKLDKIKEN